MIRFRSIDSWFSILLGTAIALGIALAGCGRDSQPPGTEGMAVIDSSGPDQVTSNARIFLYSEGRKTTDLRADRIMQYTAKDSTIAERLDVDFYDSTGVKISNLIAQRGYIREKDNFLAVNGSVRVLGEDSVRLFTEYLEWDAGQDRVVTDSFVTIIQNQDTIRSYGVETDPRLRNITFKRKVSGRLTDMEKARHE
ncbi:MAG: LPS export ABC transporter periplasmic protein LptC [candidate division Zixibacteria bacterium]|nr:LPS export ABC transporter periplasmic protein LptC [candidate division Zixibacteria bacterium]